MTDYRINSHHYPLIDPATQAAMLKAFHARLEHKPVDAEDMISTTHVWQDAVLHCADGPLLEDAKDEDGMAWLFVTKLNEDIVVGVRSIPRNPQNGNTLHEALEQAEILFKLKPVVAFVNRGYRSVVEK